MAEPKPFASLSATLLARKGGARPAMRSQLNVIPSEPVHEQHDDLGWNDMGHSDSSQTEHAATIMPIMPEVVACQQAAPPVVQQQAVLKKHYSKGPERQSALDLGRPAAFTLRIDGERHLKLRMACTVQTRSAQQLLIHALDRLLDDCPEAVELANQVRRKQS